MSKFIELKNNLCCFNLLMASCFFVLLTHVISIIRKKEPIDFFVRLSLVVLIYYYGLKNPLNISKKVPTYLLLIVCIGLNKFPNRFVFFFQIIFYSLFLLKGYTPWIENGPIFIKNVIKRKS